MFGDCKLFRRIATGLGVAMLLSAAPAAAQTDTELPPVSSTPDSFTATYADWLLRCNRSPDPAVTTRLCDVTTLVVAEGQTQPFAQITVSKGVDGAFHLTALVPVNITIGQPPLLGTDEADPGAPLPWLGCTPSGCLADVPLADADLQRLRGYAKQGWLTFADSAGNQIRVLFSFRGLAQALDAMALEQIAR